MKIAIVGSGISGMVSALLLGDEHEVTLLESDDYVGGHTHTVDVEIGGENHRVDTGFIVYNERTYPGFCRLLERLEVVTRPTDMSFSVTCDRSGLEYATHSMSGLFANRRNLVDAGFYRMIGHILRFNREARAMTADHDGLTLGEYVRGRGYSRRFVEQYLIPMGAAIWSADPQRFLDFPLVAFVRFFENHGLLDHRNPLPWRVVDGGSSTYVDAIMRKFRGRVLTRCPVLSIRRHDESVEMLLPDGVRARFDHVIMACHSDQALALLDDRSDDETDVLGAIAYQPNEVILHTDASVMPKRRDAWASWNYRVRPDARDAATVTYDMNRLQGITSKEPLFVTLNADDRIDPARVIQRFRYQHPVYNSAALIAQRRRSLIDGADRTHFCGAYWGNGFHEDGVQSALAVCSRFGREL